MTQDSALVAELHALADSDAPPSTVDVGRAVADGRRTLRRRKASMIGGTGAVAAVSLVVLVIAGHGTPDGGNRPPVPASSPTVKSPAPAPGTAEGWDPLPGEETFAWLPSWIASVSLQYESDGAVFSPKGTPGWRADLASDRKSATAYGDMEVTVTADESSFDGPSPDVQFHKDSAPPVNGRTAYWLVDDNIPPADDDELLWELPNGSWADLQALTWSSPDKRAVMLRVAAGMSVRAEPVPLPLHVDGAPTGFADVGANYFLGPEAQGKSGAAWSAEVTWKDFSTTPGTNVAIYVGPQDSGPIDDALCETAHGLYVCVVGSGPKMSSLTAGGGLRGLLKRITVLGPDPENWTTHVIG